MSIISKKNFHFYFIIILAIFISIIIINRTQFYFKEHIFSFSTADLVRSLTFKEFNSEQRNIFRVNAHRCDQIHNQMRNLINDLGPKFRLYQENDNKTCVFFILNNKTKINVDEYLSIIHENIINILNYHIDIYNDTIDEPTLVENLLEKYLKEKKVDFHTIELLRELHKISNKKINYKANELIVNSNYISYLNSYNFFGIIQFLVFILIIVIFLITLFLFKRISIKSPEE